MQFTSKFVDLIYAIVTGDVKTKILLTPLVAGLYLTVIAAFIWGSFVLDHLFGLPRIVASPWNLLLALPLFIGGFILMVFAIIYFLKAKGTPVPLSPPPTLIEIGPYRYTRNPMLTGVFLQLFGIGFYFHSISLIFIFTPLFIAFNYWELKNIEEPELEKRFGQQYKDYKKRTLMFFPKIKFKQQKSR